MSETCFPYLNTQNINADLWLLIFSKEKNIRTFFLQKFEKSQKKRTTEWGHGMEISSEDIWKDKNKRVWEHHNYPEKKVISTISLNYTALENTSYKE